MAQKTPDAPESAPLKPCTPLVAGLIVLAALLHQATHGYGSAICLLLIVIVMGGQALMLHQIRRDFAAIDAAKAAFEADGDSAHLDTIDHIALRVLHENKLLTAASKTHLQRWRAYVAEQQLPRHGA